jgi:hypothetical protein
MTSDEAAEALLIWAAGMEQIGAAAADPEALKAEGLHGLALLTRTLELGVADVRAALAVYRELLPDLQDCLARMRLMEQTIATLVRALPALRPPGQVATEAATAPLNPVPALPPAGQPRPAPAVTAARPAAHAQRKPVVQTLDLFAGTAAR